MLQSQQLIEEYNKRCNYHIHDGIQPLDFEIDFPRIQNEILNLIVKNKYGLRAVSLRLPQEVLDKDKFADPSESVWTTGFGILTNQNFVLEPENLRKNSEYLHWHPDLKDGYVKEIVSRLEEYSGLKIGRVRLAWLKSNEGYPMHVDPEPMRFHIPIFTNKYVYFIQDGKLYHMSCGKVYHIITTTEHTAYNLGNPDRLHLTFSTYTDEPLAQLIKSTFNENLSRTNFYKHLDDCGVNRQSLVCMTQINPELGHVYKQALIDNLKKD